MLRARSPGAFSPFPEGFHPPGGCWGVQQELNSVLWTHLNQQKAFVPHSVGSTGEVFGMSSLRTVPQAAVKAKSFIPWLNEPHEGRVVTALPAESPWPR